MKRATSQVDGLTRVELFGLDFVDDTSLDRVVDLVLDSTPSAVEGHPVIVTPNTDLLLQVVQTPDDRIREFFAKAWCVLPDGQPIVWASRLLGAPLRFRLTGSDLFARLWPLLVQRAIPVFVLAPSAAVAAGLEDSNSAAATLVAPMLDPSSRAQLVALASQCVAEITAVFAQVVILSLGHPRDVMIADEILQQLESTSTALPFILCLGGSAEMFLGIRKRAPRWVQRCSAEWLYRFAQEPRRLFWRYFVRDAGFVPLVWREYQAKRRADATSGRAA
jgi:N-acetylglucosaminyldiphosphoundecaprenol N-acetyl-beta-D-mannosaminyltransferase